MPGKRLGQIAMRAGVPVMLLMELLVSVQLLPSAIKDADRRVVLPLTNGLWFWSVLIALVAWTLVQRHGEAHSAPQRVTAPAR